jgi:hypothetical protein
MFVTRIAVSQSNYLPWPGYFDLIRQVDTFVFYDIVQYTKNDWRNRNKIKSANGIQWITVPVLHSDLNQSIDSIKIASPHWKKKHWNTIFQAYSKSPYFYQYSDFFADIYNRDWDNLSELNKLLTVAICDFLNIKTKFICSSAMKLQGDRNQRLLQICQLLDAKAYISGPAASSYLDTAIFGAQNIKVEWMNYSNYGPYKQQYGDYISGTSIIDLLLNEGPNSSLFLTGYTHDSF